MDFESRKQEFKNLFASRQDKIWLISAFLLFGLFSFGLGVLTQETQVSPIIIDKNIRTAILSETDLKAGEKQKQELVSSLSDSGPLVASKNGSYYFPVDCFAAKRIKKENQIFFQNEKEAQDRGYKPSATCQR